MGVQVQKPKKEEGLFLEGFCLLLIMKVGTSWDHVEEDMPSLGTAETYMEAS